MTRTTLIAVLLLAAMAAQPTALARPAHAEGAITWSYRPPDGGGERGERLEIAKRGMQVTLDAEDATEVIAKLRAASDKAAAVGFELSREAGVLTCTGAFSIAGAASGQCRFAPSTLFPAELAKRGIHLEDRDDLLGMALVDARVSSVDSFARAGLPLADSDDLMTTSALHLEPAFRDELGAAGLAITDLDDLVAARALGISRAWLSALTVAGYPPRDAEQAIEMRALDITPDYARRMGRVLANADGPARP